MKLGFCCLFGHTAGTGHEASFQPARLQRFYHGCQLPIRFSPLCYSDQQTPPSRICATKMRENAFFPLPVMPARLFMIGAVGIGMYQNPAFGPLIAAIHYLSNFICGLILKSFSPPGRICGKKGIFLKKLYMPLSLKQNLKTRDLASCWVIQYAMPASPS